MEALAEDGLRNMIPIWGTDHLEDVTNGILQNKNDIWHQFYLFEGIKPNGCPRPCTTTFVHTTFVAETSGMELYGVEWNSLLIIFSEDITITTTNMLEFNFLTSLAYIGSYLGLWLGLGALQLVQIIAGLSSRKCLSKS